MLPHPHNKHTSFYTIIIFNNNLYISVSAYPSVLTDSQTYFPVGECKRLVFKKADEFIKNNLKLCQNDDFFCIVKAKVLPFINDKSISSLPFCYVQYNDLNVLSNCKLCTMERNKLKCKHNERQREFSCTMLFKDFRYCIDTLKYTFKVHSIYYWEKKGHFGNFAKFSSYLINMRNTTSDQFLKYTIKTFFLQAIGRFALNISKRNENKSFIESYQSLLFKLQNNRIQSFHILTGHNDLCATFEQKRDTYFNNFNKSIRLNCCSLFFAVISNSIRRKIHFDSLQIINSNNLRLIRIDVDAILFYRNHSMESNIEIFNIFMKSNHNNCIVYKQEENRIDLCFSTKKRSHGFKRHDNTFIYKCCGLKMKFIERSNSFFDNIFLSKFKIEDIRFKNISCFCENKLSITIKGYPFGF